jgi:hypothetical protein
MPSIWRSANFRLQAAASTGVSRCSRPRSLSAAAMPGPRSAGAPLSGACRAYDHAHGSAGHRAPGRAPAASSLATGRNSFADRQGTPARCERSQPAGPRSRRRPRPPASNLQLEDYALTDPLAAVAAMRFSISRPRRGELARLTTPRDGGVEIALKNFSRSTLSVGRCNSTHGGASRAGNWRDALADRIRSRLT